MDCRLSDCYITLHGFRSNHQKISLASAGIFKQSMGARNRLGIGLSQRPARLHSLAQLVPWNRFIGSLKVEKFGLSQALIPCSLQKNSEKGRQTNKRTGMQTDTGLNMQTDGKQTENLTNVQIGSLRSPNKKE